MSTGLVAQGSGAAAPARPSAPADAMRFWAFETIRLEGGPAAGTERLAIAIEADLLGYLVVERRSRRRGEETVRQWFAPTLAEAVILAGRVTHERLSQSRHWRRTGPRA